MAPRTVIPLRLPLLMAGGAVFVAAMACARSGAGSGVVAIAVNQDVEARPRLAFYVGVPGKDSFLLPAGSYDLIAMDMAGGLASQSGADIGGGDAAVDVLSKLVLPAPSEEAGRLNREAMRNLFLFFARFDRVQLQLETVLTNEETEPPPASPDGLTARQILGEEGAQGRVQGIRDWETEMASWGRVLELGLQAIESELPPAFLGIGSNPFADAKALVREWRDGPAADRRAFLEVAGGFGAQRRAELYQSIAVVFAEAASEGPADFYRRVETGDLDGQMWAIANFAYENDRPGPSGGPGYGEVARAEGLEPGRPYYERWLRQSDSAWGMTWSVSVETAERARLPEEVLQAAGQGGSTTAPPVGGGLQVESP